MDRITPMTLQNIFQTVTKKYSDLPALSFVGQSAYTYKNLAEQVESISKLFISVGLKAGDKIAILSANRPEWGMTYFAINNIGAIIVPILPDFTAQDVTNILTHSESKAIVVSELMNPKVEKESLPKDFQILSIENFGTLEPASVEVPQHEVKEEDSACIIYTSGTTGQSKGVMLSNKNIVWNAQQSLDIPSIHKKHRMLSLLPLSHTYECSLGFILPLLIGAQVFYLDRPPSSSVLLPALAKTRPHLILSVPLLIEKIYRQSILPRFTHDNLIGKLYKKPFFRKKLNKIAGKKLKKLFGGRLHFFGIGGAALDPEVELFLREAKFPYAIGYGLTETSPLIAGANPKNTIYRSTGPLVPGLEVKIVDPNEKGEGEIVVKGPSIMQGYYKDESKTREVLTEDGWFSTGDLGLFGEKGHLFIKGRLKNMILGPSGENIYPEAIEALINNAEFVEESLVYEEEKTIVARIHLNYEAITEYFEDLADSASQVPKNVSDYLQHIQKEINKQLTRFSRISKVVEQKEPFERTPTKKIRRFLYTQIKKITGDEKKKEK